jgi:hypothetical protein
MSTEPLAPVPVQIARALNDLGELALSVHTALRKPLRDLEDHEEELIARNQHLANIGLDEAALPALAKWLHERAWSVLEPGRLRNVVVINSETECRGCSSGRDAAGVPYVVAYDPGCPRHGWIEPGT